MYPQETDVKAVARKAPTILVIDDDPVFLELMMKVAKHQGVPVTICRSVSELGALSALPAYDVAIIDFYLDGISNDLKGVDLTGILKDTPVVLISSGSSDEIHVKREGLPKPIQTYVNKRKGVLTILEIAIREGISHQLKLLAQK